MSRVRRVLLAALVGAAVASCTAGAPGTSPTPADGEDAPTAAVPTRPGDASTSVPWRVVEPWDGEGSVHGVDASVEALWRTWLPELYEVAFEPVAAMFAFDPSSDEGPPGCGPLPPPPPDVVAGNAYYCEEDDHIAWDAGPFLTSVEDDFGAAAAALVLAHEYGHAIQARIGVLGSADTIRLELQADCMAGAWVGAAARGEVPDPVGVDGPAVDRAVPGYLWFRDPIGTPAALPGAHGSGLDRLRAFADGFIDGPVSCVDDLVTPRPVAELLITGDFVTSGGDMPLLQLLPILDADLQSFWAAQLPGFEGPSTIRSYGGGHGDPPACRGPVDVNAMAGGAYYCTVTNTIDHDVSNQELLWYEVGDVAATYGIVHAYAQAVVFAVAPVLDAADGVLTADCLSGVWARDAFDETKRMEDEPGRASDRQILLSAGDLDEAIRGLMVTSPTGIDGVLATGVGMFDRALAFSDGFFDGTPACGVPLERLGVVRP